MCIVNGVDICRITKREAEAVPEADAECSTYDCRITKREAEAVQREAEAAAEADEGCGWQCRITKREALAAAQAMCIVNGVDICRITKREAEAVQREAEAASEADEGCGWQCRITKREALAAAQALCIVNGVDICDRRITKRETEAAPELNIEDKVRITREEVEAAPEVDGGCPSWKTCINKKEVSQ